MCRATRGLRFVWRSAEGEAREEEEEEEEEEKEEEKNEEEEEVRV